MKNWLIGKDSDAGRDWGQEEKGTTEDEMAERHHWLDGRESEWTLGVGNGQEGLACCDSWGRKESDTTVRLNWTDEDLEDLLELTPKTDVLFIIGDWNAKAGSQETPGVTGKFGLGIQNEAGQRLKEFCQENALVIANTLFQQTREVLHMNITGWSTPKSDWLYSVQPKIEIIYTANKNKTRSWLWLRSWTPYCQI